MDKSREQFEAEITKKFGDLIDQRICKNGDGEYMAWDMRVAWWAWQASRAAAEVEIPEVEKWRSPEAVRAQRAMLVLVKQAISDAGLKVKGE